MIMESSYIKIRKKEYLRPVTIDNREKYYTDMLNIEHSFSGRIGDGTIINTFIMEAAQLIINAIELFQLGYFDCAYYSLRSSVDISTTMVFLVDMPDQEKEHRLRDWKDTKDFPMRGQIIKLLAKDGAIFADMKNKMPNFFERAKQLSKTMNKYVHKQGLEYFYIARNHPIKQKEPIDSFIDTFELFLKECIGVVAVMRLAVDPFPILLMDDEILYRCFDSMTDPYSQEFVDEYICQSTIDAYKTTEIYCATYNSIICEGKKNQATFDVMKHQYINTTKIDQIVQQFHLLPQFDVVAVLIVKASPKTVKVYTANGLLMFFTEKNTNRKEMSWNGMDFARFASNPNRFNQPYDEAFISVFSYDGENYFAEHNEELSENEIDLVFVELCRYKVANEKDCESTNE